MSPLHSLNVSWALAIASIVVAGVIVFCGPFRVLILRYKTQVQRLTSAEGGTRVVLIHGTFARGAKWTRPDHSFISHVTRALGPCEIYRLLWSGDNFQGARLAASRTLVDWAKDKRDKPLYLIGHSHGGSIAGIAATQIEGVDLKVVTLAAPFIIVQAKTISVLQFASAERYKSHEGLLLVACMVWLIAGALVPFSARAALLVFCIGYAACMAAAWHGLPVLIHKKLDEGVTWLRSQAELFEDVSRIRPPPDSLLALRATADEASGVLVAMHMVSWLLVTILKISAKLAVALAWIDSLVNRLNVWLKARPWPLVAVLIAGGVAMLFMFVNAPQNALGPINREIGIVLILFAAAIPWLGIPCRFYYFLIAPALTTVATVFSAVLAIPFGLDLAFRTPIVALSAEPTPLGSWPLRIAAAGEVPLAHSSLLTGVTVEYALREWLEKSASPPLSVGSEVSLIG